MTDGKMFEDDRIEIYPVGGTGGDGITKTHDFLKDVDIHVIRQVTIEIEGDNPEQITFNIILGSSAPPILGSQYTSPRTKTYTTSTVTNKEYIENIRIKHGHIQIKQLTEMLIQEGKWQPSFQRTSWKT